MSVSTSLDSNADAHLDRLADAVALIPPDVEKEEVAKARARRALDPLDGLRRVRALAELLDLAEERAVLRAADDGQTQRAIATALGKSQTQVHRILQRARLAGTDLRVNTREVILLYQAGVISRGTMLGRLDSTWEGQSAESEFDSGYLPGPWDEIRSAYLAGLLTDEDYEELRLVKAPPDTPSAHG